MNELQKHILDYDLVFPYLKEMLITGKTLSNEILKKCDFKKGFFYTILPKNAHLESIYLFENGGIIPQEKEKVLKEFFGTKKIYQELTSVRDEMILLVYQYFRQQLNGMFVLEEILLEKKDKDVKIENIKTCFYQQEVYYVLSNKNSIEDFKNAIYQAEHVWHYLGILLSHNIELPEELAEKDFKELCASIQCLVTVAYDGESFIFWESNS